MSTRSERAAAVQLPIIPVVAQWIRENPGTLSLGQGVTGYPPPPEAWVAMKRLETEPTLHRYQAVEGLPSLVEALRSKLARKNGMRLGPERRLMVTAGANAAFQQVVLAICDPGDEVVLPLPYYFNQEMALVIASTKPVLVPPGSGYVPDLDSIEKAITPRTRAVVTVSPNNPSGAVFPGSFLRAVNALCARRGIFHVSDETYEAFVYGAATHVASGSFSGAEETTISLYSFSKAYGFASWRVGYVVYPAVLVEAMRKIQDTFMVCPPVVSQLAAEGCLASGDVWLASRLEAMSRTRERVLKGLEAVGDLAELGPSDGAFYSFLKLNRPVDSLEVTRRLIAEHRVAVIPGTAFGMTRDPYLRVSYGALTAETAEEAVGRLATGLRAILG